MKTSLQAIANKAQKDRKCRFRNLYGLLNRPNLEDTFRLMNGRAAPGVDRVTMRDYGRNLAHNISGLVDRLKEKRYRAQPVRRVNIPKGGGKVRPLGLPAFEDKLLQAAAARILTAIYEQDFLECSHGYRPDRGPRKAADGLQRTLRFGRYRFVVEADIKGFFDSIDREWLVRMLELRVDDKAFIRLIQKWLRAGVLDVTGEMLHPERGTPQGGVISPILANIYLHYVLDLWFEKVVKPRCGGEVHLCRYADDFVCAFQFERDADRFMQALPSRLEKFGLELAADKTRTLVFDRWRKEESGAFDFLGFEFRWAVSRAGKDSIRQRTSRKRLREALSRLKLWTVRNRTLRCRDFMWRINASMNGHYAYYGVIGNARSLAEFHYHAQRILFRWLNNRSQRKTFNWAGFHEALRYHRFPSPRIGRAPPQQTVFHW